MKKIKLTAYIYSWKNYMYTYAG